ncbi:esterase-like activity of phytase family protein [Sphingomonas lacunae]|uniref:Esterase-like activity of phytase family protein n=1 Tax=Sphingomonas lacunae TaxID=2698828 RepID=A0A6M4AW19_9SPHN|nr:esterase-like activity of phytase family protein [Sphingomonas lacunae]QJQ32219.1 esterase-like activity of phytase family protein [Sphingomonas lacunae]
MRPPQRNDSQLISARPVAIDSDRSSDRRVGTLIITEAWEIDSANTGFGGYSAMALLDERRFLLASDTGLLAGFTLGRDGRIDRQFIAPPPAGPGKGNFKVDRDMEALTADRARGQFWAAYEHSNQIWRFSRGFARSDGHVAPAAMRRWHANGGAEAMVRLIDGRFLILSETTGARGGGGTAALLFPTDPVESPNAEPIQFAYDAQGRGRVTDAAQLPDGRILLLQRRLSLVDGFVSTLSVAHVDTIRTGGIWRSQTLALFSPPLVTENFEGLAVEDSPEGAVIWMISDDNLTKWQRTLLLRLLLPRDAMPTARPGFAAVP